MNRTPEKLRNKRLCRNITIYGYCKFQDRGCEYSHQAQEESSSNNQIHLIDRIKQMNLESEKYVNITGMPSKINLYVSICFLENENVLEQKIGVYKGLHSVKNKPFIMKRVPNYKSNNSFLEVVGKWKKVKHSNIVNIKEAFTTKQFGDHSLLVIYEYFPLSQNLQQLFNQRKKVLPEKLIWSLIAQLLPAIDFCHAQGCIVKIIDLPNIIVTNDQRFRFSSVGIIEMFSNLDLSQKDKACDLVDFANMLSCLVTHGTFNYENCSYSSELTSFIKKVLESSQNLNAIPALMSEIAYYLASELNNTFQCTDLLESELRSQCQSEELFNLITKLSFINDRREYRMDPRWSETGDRYILKLFRDYLFDQVDELGKPLIDIGHLDSGVDEEIMLMTKDEAFCIVVTFKELKRFMNDAFNELIKL